MSNLPDLYARVVAHDPKLAVPCRNAEDTGNGIIRHNGTAWCVDDDDGLPEPVAAALIADHWTECLPIGVGVWPCGGRTPNETWNCGRISEPTSTECAPTRIEALAAFHLAQPGAKP